MKRNSMMNDVFTKFKMILLIGTVSNILHSQTLYTHQLSIDQQVWNPFRESFDSLNSSLMAKIHSKQLIRIPAEQKFILDYESCMSNYRFIFQQDKEMRLKYAISLQFFERWEMIQYLGNVVSIGYPLRIPNQQNRSITASIIYCSERKQFLENQDGY